MHTAPSRSTARRRRGGRASIFSILLMCAAAQAAAPAHGAGGARAPDHDPWWQHALIYEIYPRSFQDSNGDGVGDLNGIRQRLGYLEQLGVDAIWIAPMYPSPQVDFGYDISDYQSIDPQYGTLSDFDTLLTEAARHHIRVLLDMVLNHTSDEHPWFIEAAASRTSAHHDYYVWSDGKRGADGQPAPPNNWVSLFGGSAWQYLPALQQFYYHRFYRQQPDLNWRNPAVEAAMFAAMRFWLDRGVAGFRLDAVPELFEDPQLRDETPLGGTNAQGDPILSELYTKNLPEVHGVMRRLRAMVDAYPNQRLLIGETYLPKTADLDAWYGGAQHDELQLPMDTLVGLGSKLDAATLRRLLGELDTEIHGSQPLLVFDNHDNVRSWDRFGDGVHNNEIARIVAALLLTSRATALIYQGQELGQRTATPTRVEDVRDPIGIRGWPKEKGRDGERTPLPWDDSPQAGFSRSAKTWLPVTADYPNINVASERADPASLLNWYRRLISLRRTNPALHSGRTVMLDRDNPTVLRYARLAHGHTVLVSLNLSAQAASATLGTAAAGLKGSRWRTLLSSPPRIAAAPAAQRLELPPYGAWVAALE